MSEFSNFILDELAPLAPIGVRAMFGAVCLFKHGKMFAIIDDDRLYIKVDDDTRHLFENEHCQKFYYWTQRNGIKKQVALNYYELPERALDDGSLCEWARLGIGVALNN